MTTSYIRKNDIRPDTKVAMRVRGEIHSSKQNTPRQDKKAHEILGATRRTGEQ